VAAADRIRYLTPHLHAEMIHELRWPGDASADTGIDIHSLGLDPSDLAVLDILRRPDVMASLADWDAGLALGDDSRDRVRASSALAMLTVPGQSLIDYARGGSAAEAVWVLAQQHGLAVHPVTPLFMFARDDDDLATLSPAFATQLCTLQQTFHALTGVSADESPVLVLRMSYASPASLRSRRRPFSSRSSSVGLTGYA
jgi:hypothetical protein